MKADEKRPFRAPGSPSPPPSPFSQEGSSATRGDQAAGDQAAGDQAAEEERIRLLFDEILLALERERTLTEALLKQALGVQKHLLADDSMALLVAAQEQETCSQQLAQWEHRRLLLTRQLAATFPTIGRLRLSQWVNYLPEPYASRLHAIQVPIQRATSQLQIISRQNMALVQRSLRYAALALGMESATYNAARRKPVHGVDSPNLLDKTL